MRLPAILKENYISAALFAGLVFLSIGFAFVYINFDDRRLPIAVHWDVFYGVDFLGTPIDLFEVLSVGLGILALNAALAEAVYDRERFLSYVLVFSGVLVSLLILMAVAAAANI